MQDYEELARMLEMKAKDLREEGKAYENTQKSQEKWGVCCGACQFLSPCIPDQTTPAKCLNGCTITSYI